MVLQFTCSVALIISTLLIYRQVQYAKDRPKGYDVNRLVYSEGSDDLNRNYDALRDELLRSGQVDKVTRASAFVSNIWNWSMLQDWSGRYPDEQLMVATVDVVENYFNTVGMKLVAGTNFSGNLGADTLCVVLNEAAVRRMRFKDPLGQVITFRKGHRIKVIGVVKDAVMISPFSPAEPAFLRIARVMRGISFTGCRRGRRYMGRWCGWRLSSTSIIRPIHLSIILRMKLMARSSSSRS
ncbi:ABC transporter permease [Puia sp. P3]|uniref:ABC transporter permease n=1 Tax=Puia sp. P3 TaxID=3423952 RepID=UPI003D674DB4